MRLNNSSGWMGQLVGRVSMALLMCTVAKVFLPSNPYSGIAEGCSRELKAWDAHTCFSGSLSHLVGLCSSLPCSCGSSSQKLRTTEENYTIHHQHQGPSLGGTWCQC